MSRMKIVFVHGLGQNAQSWDNVISFMPEQFSAVCPDLFSLPSGNAPDYQNLYRDFSDYCDLMPEPINLCGLSLGGVLALNYAIDHPARVKALSLIGAQYNMPKTLLKLQAIIFNLMPKFVYKKQGVEKKEFLKTMLSLTSSMTGLDFTAKLKDISCPVIVICGDKDGANKKAARDLAKNIPNAKINIMEKTGHEVNVESPENLANLLSVFYNDLSETG